MPAHGPGRKSADGSVAHARADIPAAPYHQRRAGAAKAYWQTIYPVVSPLNPTLALTLQVTPGRGTRLGPKAMERRQQDRSLFLERSFTQDSGLPQRGYSYDYFP